MNYNVTVDASFGGQDIMLEPIRGLKNYEKFEQALIQEIYSLKDRVEAKATMDQSSPEQLLAVGVDPAPLLKLGCPMITDALIENSTPQERMGALMDILRLNNLQRFSAFLAPEMLMELAMSLNRPGRPTLLPEESEESFSEPELSGTQSSTS